MDQLKVLLGSSFLELLEKSGSWSGQFKPSLAVGHCIYFDFTATSEERGNAGSFVIYWRRVHFLWSL